MTPTTGRPLALGDVADFLRVNHFARQTGWLHGPAAAYASDGIVVFAVLLLLGVLYARRRGDLRAVARALLAPIGVLVAVALNQPVVHAVAEQRPYTRLPDALVLVHRSADASFPSDHATMAGAVAVGLLLVSWRLGLLAVGLALLMAATRVYVGAHYPVDVLAGLALGALVTLAVVLSAAPIIVRLLRWALSTPMRPLITTRPTGAGQSA